FLHRLPLSVSDRWTDGHYAVRGAVQLATDRLLLRGGALSLRVDRWSCVHHLCRPLLLVSQSDGPDADQEAGPLAFLAFPHWIQFDVWAATYRRHPRHAAARLHLRFGSGLGDL